MNLTNDFLQCTFEQKLPDCRWIDSHRLIDAHHQIFHIVNGFVRKTVLKVWHKLIRLKTAICN